MNRDTKRHAAREARRPGSGAATAVEAPPPARSRSTLAHFLRDVRSELRKVAWPNRQEVMSYTVVVLVTTTVLTLLVFGMDWVISNAVLNVF